MDQTDDIALSKSTKILFNLIEIRLFDLSQVLQVGGHKLSINQIKQALQKQHNIFGQVQKIFDQLKIHKLYDLIKQVSQNYVSIASILIDEKTSKNTVVKNKGQNQQNIQGQKPFPKFQKIDKSQQKPGNSHLLSNRKMSMLKTQQSIKSVEQINKTLQNLKAQQFQLRQKLGGISLFNQNYKRGVETLQQKHEAWEQKKRKKYGQKQLILELISKQISDQVDVQKLYDNDQISKFIREGKVKHELYSHIEYQKDLESISSFLKQSQDDAMKFLMDTKKNKQDNESKNNEDDIVVNYHELVQMLVERKKTQYKTVENKIKQIVQTFKFKFENMQSQLKIKQADIRELQYKLNKKQGIQIGSQTVGLRNRFTKNSPDAIEQLQQHHKAVVELLKKNLEENQKEILLRQTDARISEQKIKKKDIEITDLNLQIQKLKKQIKDQRQKFYNQTMNNTTIDQTQSAIDTIVQSPQIQQNQQKQVSQGKVSSHKKRKPKHSFFAIHTNNNLSAPRLTKPIQQDTIGKQNGLELNDKQNFRNYQPSRSSGFFNKKKSYINYQNYQNDQNQAEIDQVLQENHLQKAYEKNDITDEDDEKNLNQKQQFGESRKKSKYPQQRNITRQSSKRPTKYTQGRKQEKSLTNKSFKNSTKIVQVKKQSKDTNKTKDILEKQIKTFKQQKNYERFNKVQNHKIPSSNQKSTSKLGRIIQKKSQSVKNGNEKVSQNIKQINQREIQDQNDQQKFMDVDQLLSDNSQKVYNLLFRSISIQEKFNDQQKQILQLQGFLKKYNQTELYRRLKYIIDLLNKAYQDNEDIPLAFKKYNYEQIDMIKDFNKASLDFSKVESKNVTLKLPEFKEKFEKYSNSSTFRNMKANTDIEKREKQKSLQMQKNKQIKNLTKNILTKKLFKKIHNQIRISGKGLEFTKKQFYQICKNISLDQSSARKSQESSDFSQQEQQNYVNIKAQKLTVSHKIKSSKNIIKQKSLVKESKFEKSQESQKLKVQGTVIDSSQYEQNQDQNQKINNFREHLRKQSQSMKNLFKAQQICQVNESQNLIKIQKLEKTKKSTSDHFSNGQQNTDESLNEQPNTQQFKKEKKKHIQNLYKALKNQGTKIQTLKKLEEVIQSNRISLKDLIKITALVSTQKTQELSKILNKDCDQSCKNLNKSLGCSSKSCCTHIKKYSSFLQNLSINQNWLRKIKKEVFAMHILNIDGGDQHRNDFYKKKSQKQKSITRINLTTNNSQTILKSIPTESLYSSSKKNQEITNNRQALKKNMLSTHIELRQRKPYFQTKNKSKNVESVSFLPQLANKPTSQSIKN